VHIFVRFYSKNKYQILRVIINKIIIVFFTLYIILENIIDNKVFFKIIYIIIIYFYKNIIKVFN